MSNRTLIGVIDIDVDGYSMRGLVGSISEQESLTGIISKEIEIVEPVIEPLTVTENGEYSAPEDVHGYSPINVNVPLRYEEGYTDGYQASQDSITLQEKTITENGEFVTDEGFTGMSKVTVAVPIKEEQTKTVEITKNGTTEVVADEGKSMSKVTVNTNVAFEGDIGKPYIDTSKITNFTYFCYGNARMNVLPQLDTSKGTIFYGMFYSCSSLSIISHISQLDTSNGTDFNSMFYGCNNLTTIPQLDTSNGKDFYGMFYNCSNLTTIPLLDTSKGTTLNSMFYGCNNLTTIPLLDTSNNTTFYGMFYNCRKLSTIPQLDTSNGTNFYNMFYGCSNLTTIPLLDTSKGTSFSSMFYNCSALETVTLTTAKSNLSTNTFQGCTVLKNLTIGEGWAVSIYLHYSNNLTVESLHGMIENLADLTGKTAKTFQIGATNLAKVDADHIAMLQAKNWNYS